MRQELHLLRGCLVHEILVASSRKEDWRTYGAKRFVEVHVLSVEVQRVQTPQARVSRTGPAVWLNSARRLRNRH